MTLMNELTDKTSHTLPFDGAQWRHVEHTCLETARLHGYREIVVPVLNDTAPEKAASTVYRTAEPLMTDENFPLKTCCAVSCLCGEGAETSRQFGVMVFGTASPAADAELISLADAILTELGLTGYTLEISGPQTDDGSAHFESVKKYLTTMHLDYTVTPAAAGDDAGTAFALVTSDADERTVICGGLLRQSGVDGPSALGFVIDIGHIIRVMEAQETAFPAPEKTMIYLAPVGEAASVKCLALCSELREEGFSALTDLDGRSLEAQLAYVERLGVQYTVVIGDDELDSGIVSLKNTESGEQTEVTLDSGIIETLYDLGINDTMTRLNDTVAAFESLAGLEALFGSADNEEI